MKEEHTHRNLNISLFSFVKYSQWKPDVPMIRGLRHEQSVGVVSAGVAVRGGKEVVPQLAQSAGIKRIMWRE